MGDPAPEPPLDSLVGDLSDLALALDRVEDVAAVRAETSDTGSRIS
jgi:hypothetical protein